MPDDFAATRDTLYWLALVRPGLHSLHHTGDPRAAVPQHNAQCRRSKLRHREEGVHGKKDWGAGPGRIQNEGKHMYVLSLDQKHRIPSGHDQNMRLACPAMQPKATSSVRHGRRQRTSSLAPRIETRGRRRTLAQSWPTRASESKRCPSSCRLCGSYNACKMQLLSSVKGSHADAPLR